MDQTQSPDPASGDDLVDRARRFASAAHERLDQRRKYSGQSYQIHLKAVARLVGEVTGDPRAIAAAWLHDTVEDTPVTVHDVEAEFGAEVARLVAELTDVSRPGDGNRAERKAIDRAHLAGASPTAKTVKLADLIDNCQDIVRNDARFARVFLPEMAALLEVLEDGDAKLHARALRTYQKALERLGLAEALEAPADPRPESSLDHSQRHVSRLFVEAFTARDITLPLRSFDAERRTGEVLDTMEAERLQVVGVRRRGSVAGTMRAGAPRAGTCTAHARPFSPGEVVEADASLSDVILVLTRFDHCFVSMLGEVFGVISREQINSPVVRMWLFGIVSIIEMALTRRVRQRYPDEEWRAHLPQARREKAEALLEERRRRDVSCTLLDCLQLPDKARILISDGSLMEWVDLESKAAAKRAVKELESLRNHLAHAQDIVTHDWAQIARMTQRIEEIVHLDAGASAGAG